MRADVIAFLSAMLLATSASAFDAYDSRGLFANPMFRAPPPAHDANNDPDDPRNCPGVVWDDKRALSVAKVIANPHVNFIKSRFDNGDRVGLKCPAATDACRKASYLVTGDLVLVGKTQGPFTCVAYQMPGAKPNAFTEGWLPSAALTPVAPTTAPRLSDWLGNWDQPHAGIEIKEGGIGGRLQIEGIAAYKGAREVHTGAIDAQVTPEGDSITFLEDGWLPFETKCDSGCRVRMRRVGPYLLVEDNRDCGGVGVSFTGLYRRK